MSRSALPVRLTLLAGALVLGGVPAAPPWAAPAGAPSLPAAARPDVRLRNLERRASPAAPAEPVVPVGAAGAAPEGAEGISFVLQALDLTGVTAYPQGAFRDLVGGHYGARVSLAQVYDLAAAIQRRYRDDGYFLTRVLVPPQQIVGGRVRLEVAEGRVDGIDMQDDPGAVGALVSAYLRPITTEQPLRLATLERCLLLANDIPGLEVQGVLQPSPGTFGAARLAVTVKRKKLEGLATVDNIGSTFTGNWEVAGRVAANAFTRYGESLGLTVLVSSPEQGLGGDAKNQTVGAFNGSVRLGDQGAYLNALLSYGNSNPGSIISEFDYQSTQFLASLALGYPVIRSRERNLSIDGGFDYVDGDTDVFTDVALTRDRIRTLWLTGSYDFRDRWRGSSFASLSLRQGLQALGASRSGDLLLSRADAHGSFTSLRATLSRLQAITNRWALYGIVAGQYAFSPVLSEEEFDVGGMDFGRGYDPKALSGDRGVGLTAEVQYTRPGPWYYLERWQGFAFFDCGSVWQSGLDLSASLSSAGGGVRAWLAQDLTMELLVAKPLTLPSQRADGTKDPQLLFRVIARF